MRFIASLVAIVSAPVWGNPLFPQRQQISPHEAMQRSSFRGETQERVAAINRQIGELVRAKQALEKEKSERENLFVKAIEEIEMLPSKLKNDAYTQGGEYAGAISDVYNVAFSLSLDNKKLVPNPSPEGLSVAQARITYLRELKEQAVQIAISNEKSLPPNSATKSTVSQENTGYTNDPQQNPYILAALANLFRGSTSLQPDKSSAQPHKSGSTPAEDDVSAVDDLQVSK